AFQFPALLVVAQRRRGGHRDGPDFQAPHRLEVQIAGQIPKYVTQEPDRFGVEERFLAVDVVGALFARSEGEATDRPRPGLEHFQETGTRLVGHPYSSAGCWNLVSPRPGAAKRGNDSRVRLSERT